MADRAGSLHPQSGKFTSLSIEVSHARTELIDELTYDRTIEADEPVERD